MLLTSKLITCFVDGFTLKWKSQSIAYLFNASEHIYWILDIGNEVHSIWVIWTSNLQECKGHAILRGLDQARGLRLTPFWCCPCPPPDECNTRQGYIERPLNLGP
jgi:hypothetical protein